MKEIKFRAQKATGEWAYFTLEEVLRHSKNVPNWVYEYPEIPKDRRTGFKDKNDKELYENDLLRIRHKIGDDDKDYYVDAIYQVGISSRYGICLFYRKSVDENDKNQYPIHQELNFRYSSLEEDTQNQKYDNLAVMDTWGENHIFHNRWRQNYYSNDIELVGNIYENPDLLSSTKERSS